MSDHESQHLVDETFDDNEEDDAQSYLSSGDHDGDGDEETSLSAAYSALLKRLLAATDKVHRNMIVVAWETENGSEAELINVRARQNDADAELVQITTEMTTWLTDNDADGYLQAESLLLRPLLKTREAQHKNRMESSKTCAQIREQKSNPGRRYNLRRSSSTAETRGKRASGPRPTCRGLYQTI